MSGRGRTARKGPPGGGRSSSSASGRGGRGGGRGGRGGRGGGRSATGSSARATGTRGSSGLSREARKESRRQAQAAAVQKKADVEAEYFASCQREAAAAARRTPARPSSSYPTRSRDEAELFGRMGAVGIKFSSYEKIDVEVKGPGAGTVPPLEGFSSLGDRLPPFLRKNVQRMHYERPTPIQRHAIPLALDGRDLMCCAQTGSGKTCAFLLPVAAALGGTMSGPGPIVVGRPAAPRCVVLAPTRELAMQISVEAEKLTFESPLRSVVVYGGADQKKQVRDLAYGCDLVVATPGRLNDFIDRGIVSMSAVTFLVLDEAGELRDEPIGWLFHLLP